MMLLKPFISAKPLFLTLSFKLYIINKRFYPGSGKPLSSTSKPKNLDMPSTTPVSPKKYNPFISTDDTSLNYVLPSPPLTVTNATTTPPSHFPAHPQSLSIIDKNKDALEILGKKALEKTAAAQIKNKQEIVSEQLLDKKKEIHNAISGINVLKKNSPVGLVTASTCNRSNSEAFALSVENDLSVDSISDLDDLPLPRQYPSPILPTVATSSTINLKDALFKEVMQRSSRTEEIMTKLRALDEKGLLNIEEGKIKAEFYEYYKKQQINTKILVSLSKEDFLQNANFHLGVLNASETTENILLSGIQMHVIVIYTIENDQNIVWGYLTSQKNHDTVLLSQNQPFTEGNNKVNNPQYFKPIAPLLASKDNLQSLHDLQQTQGDHYIKQTEICDILKEEFIKKTLPQLQQPIVVYNGMGVTECDIDVVLVAFDAEKEQEAKKLFLKYENKLKQKGLQEAIDWLDKLKKNNKGAYPFVKKLVDEKYIK